MHTCGQSKKKKKGKKPREQQHVNEKQNKTILQLWPKHCCWCCFCCFVCFFFGFSAESRENQSMERHGRAAAATPAEAAQHRGRTKFNEIQEKGGEERSWGRKKRRKS